MSQDHPCARTTPRTRSEIYTPPASVTALACLYNITVATVCKWKGRESSQDRSHRPPAHTHTDVGPGIACRRAAPHASVTSG